MQVEFGYRKKRERWSATALLGWFSKSRLKEDPICERIFPVEWYYASFYNIYVVTLHEIQAIALSFCFAARHPLTQLMIPTLDHVAHILSFRKGHSWLGLDFRRRFVWVVLCRKLLTAFSSKFPQQLHSRVEAEASSCQFLVSHPRQKHFNQPIRGCAFHSREIVLEAKAKLAATKKLPIFRI